MESVVIFLTFAWNYIHLETFQSIPFILSTDELHVTATLTFN